MILGIIYYNYLLYLSLYVVVNELWLMIGTVSYFEEDNPSFPSFILEDQDIYPARLP